MAQTHTLPMQYTQLLNYFQNHFNSLRLKVIQLVYVEVSRLAQSGCIMVESFSICVIVVG